MKSLAGGIGRVRASAGAGGWPHCAPAAPAEPDLAVQGFTGIEPRYKGCSFRLPARFGQGAVWVVKIQMKM
jgi:hypothetical protein